MQQPLVRSPAGAAARGGSGWRGGVAFRARLVATYSCGVGLGGVRARSVRTVAGVDLAPVRNLRSHTLRLWERRPRRDWPRSQPGRLLVAHPTAESWRSGRTPYGGAVV